MKKIGLEIIKSVRIGFANELKSISSQGICLLPEWICPEMGVSAREVGWKTLFYEALQPNIAKALLEINLKNLCDLIASLDPLRSLAVVLAHPMGYLDPSIDIILKNCLIRKIRPKSFLVLDLSQSYGLYDFSSQIQNSDVTFVSFNGNKLINRHSALKIYPDFNLFEYQKHMKEWEVAAKNQMEKSENQIKWLQLKFQISQNLVRCDQYISNKNHRSNAHRTILFSKDCSCDLLQKLTDGGYGQGLLPHPQGDFVKESLPYTNWKKEIFLLFSETREKS